MSFASPQEEAATGAARLASQNTRELGNVAYPALRKMLARTFGDISVDQNGQIGIPNSVQEQFSNARSGINRDFDVAERGSQVYTAQSFKQSGNPYTPSQLDATLLSQGRMLEEGRTRAMGQLKFQEAQAGLEQFNTLMNLMSGGSSAALNLGSGFGSAQNAAIGMLPRTSREGGAFSGAIAGAGAGASLGPWGAVGGALIGGLGGYYGSG